MKKFLLMLAVTVGIPVAIATVAIVAIRAFRETPEGVLARFKEPFAKKRAQLLRVLDHLPAPGENLEAQWGSLKPTPTYARDTERTNVSFATEEQLRALANPDLKPPMCPALLPPGLNLVSDSMIVERGEAGDSERDAAALAKRLQARLDEPYLIVVRTLQYEPPKLVETGFRFTGAFAKLEAYFIDLRSETVIGTVPFVATAGFQVRGVNVEDLIDTMRENGGKELAQKLAQATGGTFRWNKY